MEKIRVIFKMYVDGELIDNNQYIGERDNQNITFTDHDNYKHIIKTSGHLIKYYRTGQTNMKLVFKNEEYGYGVYFVNGMKIDYVTKTNKLYISDHEIIVLYQLYHDDELLSTHELCLHYTEYE